jgi:VPDSG-CTERM motif
MKLFTLPTVIVSTAMCLAVQSAFGQLVVTPDANANDLANTILGAGVTLNSANYSGAAGAVGTFTGGASAGLGINTGIILTSGAAVGAVGPNNTTGYSVANGTPGSAILNPLVPGFTTYDAATLTINFTTAAAGTLFFNYVFGSEEYPEWVGQFNDVFGFFLDGTAPANNVALIPGTAIPVSIDTINAGANSGYYIDNNGNNVGGSSPANIQYDGFTVPLSVTVSNLAAGTHTITLAIADANDQNLDSGVFIQGGTLSTNQTLTGVPDVSSTFTLLGVAFSGMALLRRKK